MRNLFILMLISKLTFSFGIEANSFVDHQLFANGEQDQVYFENIVFDNLYRSKKICKPHFRPNIVKKLDLALEEAFVNQKMVGVIAAIWVPGKGMWIRTKGLANIKKGQHICSEDEIRIASITKTFTTTVLLQLVDEGLLRLNDPLSLFNTGIPNAEGISIRQLCNHTSGLCNYTEDPIFNQLIFEDPCKEWAPQELVQIAIDHGPNFPPGTQVQYNNTNFILQGMIIEQLTGSPLHKEIHDRIVKPLRLKHTSLPITACFTDKFAHGYIVEEDEITDFTFFNPSFVWATGGMISNLQDLKRWAKVLATGGLLSSRTQRKRLTFVSPSSAPGPFQGPFLKYGLGIEKLGPFLGHEGDVISYNSSMNYLPKHDATFIVLINKNSETSFPNDGATSLFKALSKIIFPNEVPW